MSVTEVKVSAVIPMSYEALWTKIIAMDFSWWNLVASAQCTTGCATALNSLIKVTFKDNTEWTIRVTTISGERKQLEFEVLDSVPAPGVSTMIHSIRLHEVTVSKQALFEWRTSFSSDATQAILQDNRYKKEEAFKALHCLA